MHGIVEIVERGGLPQREAYYQLVKQTSEILRDEDQLIRPRDSRGMPGGLIRLGNRPTVVVPDLHGRTWFLLHVLALRIGEDTVGNLLQREELQLVCVGDGFHSESRGAERWKRAFKEFAGKYRRHSAMDEEMSESLGLMEMVMRLKTQNPRSFHFLKGNHENILNEEGRGNHPFRKFSYEGEMVKEWILKFYDEEFLHTYAEFEHELPLVAADDTFMISHAEPERSFSIEEVVGYRESEEVVLGLTWTPNDGADDGGVEQMIEEFCTSPEQARYFGGHRPVPGIYELRAHDRYVQLHNPGSYSVAVLYPGRAPDPDNDIVVIQENNEETLRTLESL